MEENEGVYLNNREKRVLSKEIARLIIEKYGSS
jgi:hypothetical protein